MNGTDVLKNLRSQDYGSKPGKSDDAQKDDSQTMTRIIKLTDDEQKMFEGSEGEVACEVHGTLEKDGHFHVMSVSPQGASAPDEEKSMAGQVAQRVMPTIQPSPS